MKLAVRCVDPSLRRIAYRMADLGWAIDAYLGHLARAGRRPATLTTYRRLLEDFARLVPNKATYDLDLADYERFLSRWIGKSPSTLASGVSLVKGFSRFLYERGIATEDVAHSLKRPRRLRPEDIAVVSISGDDARQMLLACETWQELLCVGAALYLGWRRAALNRARRGDVDLARGTMSVAEKGGKVLTKPIPDEYLEILRQAESAGVWDSPEAYLIPNRRPASVRRPGERSDKVIWVTVKRVAERAGVRSHVHALRAAYATRFDEQHPDSVLALKDLLGHARVETTLVYLRRRDREQAMEKARDLSWGASVFESQAPETSDLQEEAHTGFEPVLCPDDVLEPLFRKLAAIRARAPQG
jgi:integrase